MRPSLPLLVRVIPRSQLSKVSEVPRPLPEPLRSDIKKPTLIEILQRKKAEAGEKYPTNIRIEPILTKKRFVGIPADIRERLRATLKER